MWVLGMTDSETALPKTRHFRTGGNPVSERASAQDVLSPCIFPNKTIQGASRNSIRLHALKHSPRFLVKVTADLQDHFRIQIQPRAQAI